ncbi:MAG: outer membrane protein [Alphaproteobacteria bacterium]
MRGYGILAAAAAILAGTAGAAANGPAAEGAPEAEGSIGYGVYEVHDWAGIYVGVLGGWLWGEDEMLETLTEFGTPTDTPRPYDTDGFTVGGVLGINMQTGPWVYGGEVDLEYADFSGRFDWGNGNGTIKEIGILGSLRARAGYATDWFYLYGTGGLAAGDVDMVTFDGPPPLETISGSQTEFGWTAGGGIEVELWDDWSAGVEYRYTDLGTTEINGFIFPVEENGQSREVDRTYTHTNRFHAVRARLIWRMHI